MLKNFSFSFSILLFLSLESVSATQELQSPEETCSYYVSLEGNNNANGKRLHTPFKTLEKARDTIQKLKENKGLPMGGVTVCLREGIYKRTKSFELTRIDSGKEMQPIVYKAYKDEKVRIIGAENLNTEWFTLLSKDSKDFNRLDERAKGNVYSVNLKQHGIENYGTLKERGFGAAKVSALELFVNSEPMTLSRWPDKDKNEVKEQSEKDETITLYGEATPNIKGLYEKYLTSDGVNSYKRKELINGLQYYLYRHTWVYLGQSYTAWFLSTDHASYPRSNNPFFADYNTGFNNLIANNGGKGRLSAKQEGAINHGYAFIKEVSNNERTFSTYNNDRVSRWKEAKDLWFHGYWKNSWSDLHLQGKVEGKKITLSHPPKFGLQAGQYYYVENLLEELTQAGEWYLDREEGILYFWPIGEIENQNIMVSMMEEPLFKLDNTSYIEFKNITFELSRANLIEIRGKENKILNSTLRNAGNTAVVIGGYHNKINNCEIYNTGDSGVRITGNKEDKKELYKANNIIENSNIHHTSQWSTTSFPGIKISESIGNKIRHNTIHSMPYTAILFEGNEHLIEYNNIHNTNQFSSDAGAIYIGRHWGWRGNTIRYNFIHDIDTHFEGDGVHGIYLDDVVSGIHIYKNIFYNIEDYGVYTGGGRDNIIEKNIFVKTSGLHTDCRGTRAIDNKKGSSWNFLEKLTYNKVDYQKDKWKLEYPLLAKIPNNWNFIKSDTFPDNFYKNKERYSRWFYPEGSKFIKNRGLDIKNWIHDGCHSVSCEKSFADISRNNPQDNALKNIEMSLEAGSSLFSLDPEFKKIGKLPQ